MILDGMEAVCSTPLAKIVRLLLATFSRFEKYRHELLEYTRVLVAFDEVHASRGIDPFLIRYLGAPPESVQERRSVHVRRESDTAFDVRVLRRW